MPTNPPVSVAAMGRLNLSKLRALAARAHTTHVKLSAIWRDVDGNEDLKEVAGFAMCGAAELSAALKAAIRQALLAPKTPPTKEMGCECI